MISPVLPTINILYENPAWIPPLHEALVQEGFRVRLVHVDEGSIDSSAAPPDGIWMNRISPSSHTRGHVHTVELARQLLYWLESSGRRVINGLSAFELEMSKLRQDLVLRRHGIRTPRTVLAVGREHLLAAAATFDGPFITKHDQGGKGLGIRLFHDPQELEADLDGEGFDAGPGASGGAAAFAVFAGSGGLGLGLDSGAAAGLGLDVGAFAAARATCAGFFGAGAGALATGFGLAGVAAAVR